MSESGDSGDCTPPDILEVASNMTMNLLAAKSRSKYNKCYYEFMEFGALGKVIASYLQLTEPELYKGQCFRRTSATLLVDTGGDITALKRHGGWKSTTVAESYLDDSMTNKIAVSNSILNSIEDNRNEVNINIPSPPTSNTSNNASCPVQIQFHNCNIQNINNYYK